MLGSFDSPVMSAFFDVKLNKRCHVSSFSKGRTALTFWVKEFTNSALDCLIVKKEGTHHSNHPVTSHPACQLTLFSYPD